MMSTVRYARNRAILLPWLVGIGCVTQTPSDTPSPPPSVVAPSPQTAAADTTTTFSNEAPPDRPECDCGAPISPPQDGCTREAWFCNNAGNCGCRKELASAGDVRASASEASKGSTASTVAAPGGQGCSCVGASVSSPEGECAPANWFCNASGLCRCRE